MHFLYINILIFKFCLLHVLNPKDHLQEDGFVYRIGVVYFTYSSVNSPFCITNCCTERTAYTDACKTYSCTACTAVCLKINPLDRKM
jgi:hypothetical protein